MGIALAKLAEEDPTFKVYTDEETGQTIICLLYTSTENLHYIIYKGVLPNGKSKRIQFNKNRPCLS